MCLWLLPILYFRQISFDFGFMPLLFSHLLKLLIVIVYNVLPLPYSHVMFDLPLSIINFV